MIGHVVATAALMLALGAAPAPSATPTAAPDSTSLLPEIGRVRATTPACAAMRDLILPSFAAARRADIRFEGTRVRLPEYVTLAADPWHKTDIFRTATLAKLDADATAILNETLVLNKALGDPRFKDTSDPALAAEHAELAQLYATQQARANQLQQFVMRERNAVAKHGMEDSGAFKGKHAPASKDDGIPADAPPAPATTGPPGMPVLNGQIAMSDKAAINQWSFAMAAAVRASENQAARTFLPIADNCL